MPQSRTPFGVLVAVGLLLSAASTVDVGSELKPANGGWFVSSKHVETHQSDADEGSADIGESVRVSPSPLTATMRFTLKGGRGQHFCSSTLSGTVCDAEYPGKWEIFHIISSTNGRIGLKSGPDQCDGGSKTCDAGDLHLRDLCILFA